MEYTELRLLTVIYLEHQSGWKVMSSSRTPIAYKKMCQKNIYIFPVICRRINEELQRIIEWLPNHTLIDQLLNHSLFGTKSIRLNMKSYEIVRNRK